MFAMNDGKLSSDKTLGELAKALVFGALPREVEGFGPRARADAAAFAFKAVHHRKAKQASFAVDTFAATNGRRAMRLAVVNGNMPFLVDSICAVLAQKSVAVDRLLHPVLSVARNESGDFVRFGKTGGAESLIYIEAEWVDAKTRAEIRTAIQSSLTAVRHAVADWPKMQAAMRADAAALALGEDRALLDWLAEDHVTSLGHVAFNATGDVETSLGIGLDLAENLLSREARTAALTWFRRDEGGVLIVKSNLLSPVHRRVPLDLFICARRDEGQIIGLSLHAGLWTSSALQAAPEDVPILRARLAVLQAKYGFDPVGHAGKALSHALASLPHDLLISIPQADVETLVLTAMSAADRPRARLEIVSAPLDRHSFAFVWLPRDELTTARREAIGALLMAETKARLLSWTLGLGDGDVALIRYALDLRGGGKTADVAQLNTKISAIVRGWMPAVEASLSKHAEPLQATRLALRYAAAFPMAYRDGAGADEAALDILCLQALADEHSRKVRLYRNPDDDTATLRLKLYCRTEAALSDVVPALENFGFRVVGELSTMLDGGRIGAIQKYVLKADAAIDLARILANPDAFETEIASVIQGVSENDRFNCLMIDLELTAFDVAILRVIFRYLRQVGLTYGLQTVVDALRRAPDVTRNVMQLFAVRHQPRKPSAEIEADLVKAISRGLSKISALDDDRILRAYRDVVLAVLRTNAFAKAGKTALAFKIDSALVPGVPNPKPWREIFVYSPRVEGIHLRAGPVARGGLRWSDRRDDYRTEILGLMKAQRVKNAVIVPTGAKGGFYPKALPDVADREAWLAEGTECYRIFIRALLSVTDNLVEGKIVQPAGVRVRDDDDPYFVVAADKGTATFSDVANAIALEQGFWLGDAFASGGSVGYDHKAMGITAKGAWISVQRHFSEIGVDVQSTPVRVVGCGDMSGDVFGNGMLLSKSIKLVAAFDHRHIFLDPEPDPSLSWAERARLFALPRSSWENYDVGLISKGGGVYPRSAKTIPLTKQVRMILGVEATSMEPSLLIQAILKAQVDLLWFGGIGTYIKAASESHGEAGDRTNDANRVNGEDVRAKAIGEGANLGLTQAARIAYALQGGRINTDFIDNSAGVDCSDNEVNIKIALGAAVAARTLAMPKRDALLVKMTDDVATLVLEDNRLQTLALSIAERDGVDGLPAHLRLIETFEAGARLDRAVEGLAPNDLLLRRAQDGQGLARPELAVLLATAKLALQAAIEDCPLRDDLAALPDLLAAFPGAMRKRYRAEIMAHPLRPQIIATKLANRIINRLGLTHPFELADESGKTLGDVAEAFVIVEQIHDLASIWVSIETADVTEETRVLLFDQLAIETRAQMADVLRNSVAGRQNDQAVAAYAPLVKSLQASPVSDEVARQTQAFASRLSAAGAPKRIVDKIVRLAEMDGAIGLAALSIKSGAGVAGLTKAFTVLGTALGLDWAQGSAMQLDPRDPWERLLTSGVARDFQAMRLEFLGRLAGDDPAVAVSVWLSEHAYAVSSFRAMIDRARAGMTPSPAMLAQIAGQARTLLAR
jgi:glutamate dehydrogenase